MRHYRDIPPWRDVTDEQWGNWKWQLSHRITGLHQLGEIIHLTPEERDGIERATAAFPLSITPYYASLMDPDDPACPVRMLAVPTSHELTLAPDEKEDPLDEQVDAPVPLIVHRYPDRVLFLITDMCSMYCRHCTRRHFTAEYGHAAPKPKIDAAIDYIRRTPAVRDVLVSGGDALLVGDEWLEYVLGSLRTIPHVEVVRLGTRMPVVCPQRITPELCAMLRRHHPLYLNTHFNHSKEITPEAARACEMLVDAGIPVGNQVVLLRNLNDCPVVMKQLMHDCLRIRVRPYYIYQCDMTPGLSHFRTTISKGLEIMEMLRGHTTGFAVPTYVVDAPGGGGKIPVMPNYVLSMNEDKVILRNYEGVITSYTQPRYPKRSEDPCPLCGTDHRQLGGMGELFYGGRTALEPAGLDRRRRGGGGHSHAHEGVGASDRTRAAKRTQPVAAPEAGVPMIPLEALDVMPVPASREDS